MADEGGATRMVRAGYLVAGRYRLVSRLGSGAMGAVWLARDQLLNREVAVKQVLSTAGMSDAEAADQRARALREGRTAARLTHPHSVTMYDVAIDGGEPWLVMEHLPSRSLAAIVAEGGPLPPILVAQIGAQVADALAAAHDAGVIHRDVKPGNVLIVEGGRAHGTVKISDFGISRAHGDVTVTATGIITGTPAFFAPEVARGEDSTPASDVFALGATLYAAVEGTPPFGLDENLVALLHRVAAGEVSPPQRAASLRPSLLHMLEPDPRNRPTMAQARDELAQLAAAGGDTDTRSVLTDATTVLRTPSGLPSRSAQPTLVGGPAPLPRHPTATLWPVAAGSADRRRRTVVLAAASAVLLVLAGLAVFFGTPDSTPTGAQSPAASGPTSSVDPPPASATVPPAATAPPEAVTAAAQQVRQAVSSYFGLLPEDTSTAWDRLTPAYQAQGKRSDYDKYWRGFDTVAVSDVQVTGTSTALVTVELTPSEGDQYPVLEQLTFAPDPAGGDLLISDSSQVCNGAPTASCPGPGRGHGKGNG